MTMCRSDRPGLIGYDSFWDTVNIELRAACRPEHRPGAASLRGSGIAHAEGIHPTGLQADGAAHHQWPVRASPDHWRRHLRPDRIQPPQNYATPCACIQPGIEDMGGRARRGPAVAGADRAARDASRPSTVSSSPRPLTPSSITSISRKTSTTTPRSKSAPRRCRTMRSTAPITAPSKRSMECTDEPPTLPGFQIWQYQIEWQERRVERNGYLFFGAPERSPHGPARARLLRLLHPAFRASRGSPTRTRPTKFSSG